MDLFGKSALLGLNDTVKLPRAIEPGGIVVVQSASWDSSLGSDNTSISFLNNNGDYLLHVSLRQGDNVIVFNSRTTDGDWGAEERLSLSGTFVTPRFNVSVWDQCDRYEIFFSYQLVYSFDKRLFGLISSVAYYTDSNSPLSEALAVSTLDAMGDMALTNSLACSDIRLLAPLMKDDVTGPATTAVRFKHGTYPVALPESKKNDRLGFEYAEHSFFGDAITLVSTDGSKHTAKDYRFRLSNNLSLTYGEINGLGGDFYGTNDPISDGSTKADQKTRFVAAFKTLASPSKLQPSEGLDLLSALQEEVDVVNAALQKHEDPSIAYSKIPEDEWKKFQKITSWRFVYGLGPTYLGLAKINFDHFGADARTAYNAGHSVAIDEAVKRDGDLNLAYALNAFADHFLEDSFSAGHLRTTRRDCHSDWMVNPWPDLCAKAMHDEDCAIGLSVTNPKGNTWTCYGDKRALDAVNEDNKNLCLAAVQASADEIYNAWKTKRPPDTYTAWNYAPTLESASASTQELAPLFRLKNGVLERRKTIKARRTWEYTTDFTFMGTYKECMSSHWWDYPITIDGPTWILPGSSVTATTPSSGEWNVYYQDVQGGIRQSAYSDVWTASNSSMFTAKRFTPLAVVAWNGGNEIRVYCLSEDDLLQEWCYSSENNQNGWFTGDLTDLQVRAAPNTSIAAIQWDEGSEIRVYCQGMLYPLWRLKPASIITSSRTNSTLESTSDAIQEFCSGSPWTRGQLLPTARTGSSIAVVGWSDNGVHLRVYCQAPDLTLKEYCWDPSNWYDGDFSTDKAPRHSSISAIGWYDSGVFLRVYWHDSSRNFTGSEYNNGSWADAGTVIELLPGATQSSSIQWDSGEKIRFYYQARSNDILEQCNDGDGNGDVWYSGSVVATSS